MCVGVSVCTVHVFVKYKWSRTFPGRFRIYGTRNPCVEHHRMLNIPILYVLHSELNIGLVFRKKKGGWRIEERSFFDFEMSVEQICAFCSCSLILWFALENFHRNWLPQTKLYLIFEFPRFCRSECEWIFTNVNLIYFNLMRLQYGQKKKIHLENFKLPSK